MVVVCALDPGVKNFGYCIANVLPEKIKIIECDVVSLSERDARKIKTEDLCGCLIDVFNSLDCFNDVELFLVEQQYQSKKNNVIAVVNQKLMYFIVTYFHIYYPEAKVQIYSPRHKTKELKNKRITKYQRKKYCIQKCERLLVSDDVACSQDIIDSFSSKKKKDDMADAFCMIHSFWILKNKKRNYKHNEETITQN